MYVIGVLSAINSVINCQHTVALFPFFMDYVEHACYHQLSGRYSLLDAIRLLLHLPASAELDTTSSWWI